MGPRFGVGALVAVAASIRWLGGCTSARETAPQTIAPEARSSSPCSTGPLYSWDYPFPVVSKAPDGYFVETRDPPTCTTHCGTVPNAANYVAYPYESLPSGSCASEGELCSMRARPTCPCPIDAHGANDGQYTFYCRCSGGQWGCEHVLGGSSAAGCTQEAGACHPNLDASAE